MKKGCGYSTTLFVVAYGNSPTGNKIRQELFGCISDGFYLPNENHAFKMLSAVVA
jgi:hypothetical protein